jgi:hypothetical protein
MNQKILQLTVAMIFTLTSIHVRANQCENERGAADRQCDEKQVREAKIWIQSCTENTGKAAPQSGQQGGGGVKIGGIMVPALKECTNVTLPKAYVDLQKYVERCESQRNSCISACESERDAQLAEQNQAGAQNAENVRQYCESGQPKRNEDAGRQAGMNLQQLIPAIAGILASLGLGKGDETKPLDDCLSQPNQQKCRVDTATKGTDTPNTTTGSPRQTSGEDDFLNAGLNGNDMPMQGEPTAPNLATGSAGFGGGGGMGMGMPGMGAPAGRSRSPEPEVDGSPKINLAGMSGGAAGRGGGSSMGGSLTPSKSGNSAIASRTSIDGDGKAQGVVEKALQARGIASEGPLGGVSAAHSLDNFQKIEKRIQSERNQLSEL